MAASAARPAVGDKVLRDLSPSREDGGLAREARVAYAVYPSRGACFAHRRRGASSHAPCARQEVHRRDCDRDDGRRLGIYGCARPRAFRHRLQEPFEEARGVDSSFGREAAFRRVRREAPGRSYRPRLVRHIRHDCRAAHDGPRDAAPRIEGRRDSLDRLRRAGQRDRRRGRGEHGDRRRSRNGASKTQGRKAQVEDRDSPFRRRLQYASASARRCAALRASCATATGATALLPTA